MLVVVDAFMVLCFSGAGLMESVGDEERGKRARDVAAERELCNKLYNKGTSTPDQLTKA